MKRKRRINPITDKRKVLAILKVQRISVALFTCQGKAVFFIEIFCLFKT